MKVKKDWEPIDTKRERPEVDWKKIIECDKKGTCSNCEKSFVLKKVAKEELKETVKEILIAHKDDGAGEMIRRPNYANNINQLGPI